MTTEKEQALLSAIPHVVEAISTLTGGLKVNWYEVPVEGWDALVSFNSTCQCRPGGSCYCCDGASMTKEQVDALKLIGLEINDGSN